jgi:hypothetical protein
MKTGLNDDFQETVVLCKVMEWGRNPGQERVLDT